MIGRDLQAARIHPVLVVSAIDIGVGAAIAAIAAQVVRELRLKFLGFFVAESLLGSDTARPLQRRARGVIPYSLQIRIAPRRMRYPGLLNWSWS